MKSGSQQRLGFSTFSKLHTRAAWFAIVLGAVNLGACAAGTSDGAEDVDVASAEEQLNTTSLVGRLRAQLKKYGVTEIRKVPKNKVRPELLQLGRALSFDKVLSGNKDIACLTCHHPTLGTDDDRSLPIGEGGSGLGGDRTHPTNARIPRNAPALFNMHDMPSMFWDSRVELTPAGLQTPAGAQLTPAMKAVFEFGVVSAQAMFPVTSREEMRGHPGDNELANLADNDLQGIWAGLMVRLGAIPRYVQMFEAAYPGTRFEDMTFAHAANAIAGFEVRLGESRNSPFHKFVQGRNWALGRSQLQGAVTFFDVGCANCHSGPLLSDFDHHNTGLAQFGPGKGQGANGRDDFGHGGYAFRSPTLYNSQVTGPFGHAGQYPTLAAHVAHYVDPDASLLGYDIRREVSDSALHGTQVQNQGAVLATLDPAMDRLRFAANARTARQQVAAIVEFLRALTDRSVRSRLNRSVPASVPSGLPVAD